MISAVNNAIAEILRKMIWNLDRFIIDTNDDVTALFLALICIVCHTIYFTVALHHFVHQKSKYF